MSFTSQINAPQVKVPATYMRGGTSKGVFFSLNDLPKVAQTPGAARDALLLRVIGSPDPYGKHTDGMGGGTSSTSKTVIISESERLNHDVDYLFGQVAIDKPFVDWSGNCGNLTAAVGAFAIRKGLVGKERIPENGICTVRIWQVNIGKTIIAHIPILAGEVQETGDFELDGVTFPAAEVCLAFLDPVDQGEAMFPTGNLIDTLDIQDTGLIQATLINAGIPTIFVSAEEIGFNGTERQEAINSNDEALARLELIRAHGAIRMGLIQTIEEISGRQHTPKVAFVAPPVAYQASSGKLINASDINILVRAMSMGKLHHAMMGTVAVAIAAASVVPGTLVQKALAGEDSNNSICFGHPSGTLKVGALAGCTDGQWQVSQVTMSRSARVLMEGQVLVPADSINP